MRNSRIGPPADWPNWSPARAAKPTVLISASAIGYYGYDRGDETLTEDSERGDGFLADVVADWEDATAPGASRPGCGWCGCARASCSPRAAER